jgi:hypothetical protein
VSIDVASTSGWCHGESQEGREMESQQRFACTELKQIIFSLFDEFFGK